MTTRFRSVLSGTCLLNGRHAEGPKYAAECPVLRRAQRRQGTPESPTGGVDPPRRNRRPQTVTTAAERTS